MQMSSPTVLKNRFRKDIMKFAAAWSDFLVVFGTWLRKRSAHDSVKTPYFAGLLASAKLKKKVKVEFDGLDWIFRWEGGGAVQAIASFDPRRTFADNDLYFHSYSIKKGDKVAVIGVENGAELPHFCNEVGSSGRVYAIEPDPSCFRRLQKLKAMLNLDNLELVNAAAGAENGSAWLTQADSQGTSNSILKDAGTTQRVEVPLRTLTDIFSGLDIHQLDYVKMNIEGAEYAALKGIDITKLNIRNWCISCHDFIGVEFRTYQQVNDWLQAAGYSISRYSPVDAAHWWRNYYIYGNSLNT